MASTATALGTMTVLAVLAAALAPAGLLVQASAKLPSNFKRCHADDPKLSECLRLAVEDAFHKMKDGISSLGVLPVDPLKVEQIKINQGQGAVSLNMDLTNITIVGLAGTTMTNYSADLDNGVLLTESLTPLMRMDFHHVVGGRILLLPMRGAGLGSITLKELTTHHYLKYIPKTKKDGRVYWNMQEYKVKFDPKSISMDFQGLFEGEGRLGDQLNQFLNQNARLIFDEIGTSFEDAFGAVFKEITSRVFNKVPFNDVFLPKAA